MPFVMLMKVSIVFTVILVILMKVSVIECRSGDLKLSVILRVNLLL